MSFALPGFQMYLRASIETMSLSVTVLHNVQGGGERRCCWSRYYASVSSPDAAEFFSVTTTAEMRISPPPQFSHKDSEKRAIWLRKHCSSFSPHNGCLASVEQRCSAETRRHESCCTWTITALAVEKCCRFFSLQPTQWDTLVPMWHCTPTVVSEWDFRLSASGWK